MYNSEKGNTGGKKLPFLAVLAAGCIGGGGGFFGGHVGEERTPDENTFREANLIDRLATWERVRLDMKGNGDQHRYRAVCNVVERIESAIDACSTSASYLKAMAQADAEMGEARKPVTFAKYYPSSELGALAESSPAPDPSGRVRGPGPSPLEAFELLPDHYDENNLD